METEEFTRHARSGVNQSGSLVFFCDGDVGVGKTLLDFGVVYLDELQLLF